MTIDEARSAIGAGVVYRPPGAERAEDGVITSVNNSYVFVRYGAQRTSQATYARDLTLLASHPAPAIPAEGTTPMTAQRYRKRPVVIEAMHWDGYPATATVIIDWMLANGGTARYHDGPSALSIDTLEGTMTAVPGDYVIKGVMGEFYPCKEEIFEATYESAEGTTS